MRVITGTLTVRKSGKEKASGEKIPQEKVNCPLFKHTRRLILPIRK
jgi:hypothetical protein